MKREIPYDARRSSLYTPEVGRTIFKPGSRPSDGLLSAEAARLVYKKFEREQSAATEVREALGLAGFEAVEFFNSLGSQALASRNERTSAVIVAFRGTEQDPTDIATDLHAWLVPWDKSGRVHEGFRDAFRTLWPKIDSWLNKHSGALIFTGHSLGAALATLAAAMRPTGKLVTFGSPRVGDGDFVAMLRGLEVVRYVDCCDIVSEVPPEALGYVHTEGRRYIDRTGVVHGSASDSFIVEDQLKARAEYVLEYAWRLGNVAVRDLADHAPVNYVGAVQAAEKK
jgi:pimeloyl-ACP methyl ester carboxylesterase